MKISARIENAKNEHRVSLKTNEQEHSLTIPANTEGFGSSVNGGELLFLALATCYCNDIYREANKRGIEVQRVEVEVFGEFGTEGEPARNVTYGATVAAKAQREKILELMRHTDSIAEIQNRLRSSSPVMLSDMEARTSDV
jgi:uncharacterized OsmC-like protein